MGLGLVCLLERDEVEAGRLEKEMGGGAASLGLLRPCKASRNWAARISVKRTGSAQLAPMTCYILELSWDSMTPFPEMWVTSLGEQASEQMKGPKLPWPLMSP